MLNDESREARVVLRGLVNGRTFEVERVVKVGCAGWVVTQRREVHVRVCELYVSMGISAAWIGKLR